MRQTLRFLFRRRVKQYNLLPAPPVPAEKARQKEATREQVSEYNKLAKYYNDKLNAKQTIIKAKDVARLKYLYGLMSDNSAKVPNHFQTFLSHLLHQKSQMHQK